MKIKKLLILSLFLTGCFTLPELRFPPAKLKDVRLFNVAIFCHPVEVPVTTCDAYMEDGKLQCENVMEKPCDDSLYLYGFTARGFAALEAYINYLYHRD